MSCNGNGRCFIKCNCFGLYNLPKKEALENCKCDYSKATDRENETFSFRKAFNCDKRCELQKCSIYNHCKMMCPQWVLDEYGGNDIWCAMGNTMFHKKVFLEIIDQCPVCYEDKYMVEFGCKHNLCFECMWSIYTNQQKQNERISFLQSDVLCPLCRDPISNIIY